MSTNLLTLYKMTQTLMKQVIEGRRGTETKPNTKNWQTGIGSKTQMNNSDISWAQFTPVASEGDLDHFNICAL